MFERDKILNKIDENKGYIFGTYLSTIIFKYAIGNIALALLILFAFYQIFTNRRFHFNKQFNPLIILFSIGFVSVFWTTQLSNTLQGISLTLPFILIPIIVSQYSSFSKNDLTKLFRTTGVFLVFYFVIGLINAIRLFIKDRSFSHFFYHDLVSVFDNNAIYISLLVGNTIIYFLASRSIKNKLDYILLAVLYVYLFLLSSKNIIITTILLSVFTSLSMKSKAKYLLFLVLIPLLFFDNPIKARFITDFYVNFDKVWFGQDFYNYAFTGAEVRVFQWRILYEMFESNFIGLFGLGLNNVNYLINQYFSFYNLYNGYFFINFHNQYLQSLGELGIIGLLYLLYVFITALFKTKKLHLYLIFLLIAVSFLTESFLSRQKGIVLFTIIYTVLVAYTSNFKKEVNN